MWQKYNYINTIEKIQELDRFLMNTDGTNKYELTSYDTETNGLRIHKNTIVGFSLSIDEEKGWYIPLLEWIPDFTTQKTKTKKGNKYEVYTEGHLRCVWTGKDYPEFFTPKEYEMPDLIPMLIDRWVKGTKVIMHNAPFDVNMTYIATGVDLTDDVICDTALLAHVLNENSPNALKTTAGEWAKELGFNAHADAAQEQKELGVSVFKNGGAVTDKFKPKHIWRAEPHFMSKYACADTFLTFGVYRVGIQKLIERFGDKGFNWFFNEEVMPVCKEVVIGMKRKGVFLDIAHFEQQKVEIGDYLNKMEDEFQESIKEFMPQFTIGKSIDEEISHKAFVLKIIELEGLSVPVKHDKKTKTDKETIAKGVVKKVYQDDPHWIWGYILGEDEIKYTEEEQAQIKLDLYKEKIGRRYRFNLGSDNHLRWLFCDMLGLSKTDLPQTDSATKDNPIPSMKAEVLKEHMAPKFKWINSLMIYKKLRKLHSTYILPALELSIDGWLYVDMKQNGTVSGRFACGGGFNLQTLPNIDKEMETLKVCDKCYSEDVMVAGPIDAICDRTCNSCGHVEQNIIRSSVIKKGFIVPPGYKIVNADYASLEPRAFAFMSGDDKLKQVYWEGLDLYSKVYCDMFDVNNEYSAHPDADNFLKKKNKNARTETKPIVLGIPYGSSAYQVAIMCNKFKEHIDKKTGKMTKRPDVEYGQWVIDTYLGTYPELAKYMEDMELKCVTQGFIESLYGRRRHFQHAPIIYRFLRTKRLTHKDMVDCKPWMLKKAVVSGPSNLGNQMNFTEEDLKGLCKELKIDFHAKVMPGGAWSYIRGLLKNELNNAKNWPIQCLAGSVTNMGMLDTTRRFKKQNLNAWVFLQVHDEVSCYVLTEEADVCGVCLIVGLEKIIYAMKLDVPMIADPIICDNLKDAK